MATDGTGTRPREVNRATTGQRRDQPDPTRNSTDGSAAAPAKPTQNWSVEGPNPTLMRLQMPVWNFLMDHYFRMEMDGWHRLPAGPSLLVGVHSGGSLTMDAWTLCFQWYRRFGTERIMHGTAHDVLMAAPGLGDYFRGTGVIPPTKAAMGAAFDAGHDVVLWPGGEQDAMRNWRKRDTAVLANRRGFVRFAIQRQVPIVPVATVGGHDTVFVLSEGRYIARWTGLGKRLRGATIPIISGFPLPLAVEILPMHLPLPAKIRTDLLEPIELTSDTDKANDTEYVDRVYHQVQDAIQAGMDRLAKRRSFPIFG
jgi:1-acyl-sn-glycerol-3-phosphate acyltransferase